MMQDQNTPLVSVSCLTYNHEAFIADAIEGFLRQQTPFPVEILIHDDASTDRTADIVRAYERAHPEKIRAIYQHENQTLLAIAYRNQDQPRRCHCQYTTTLKIVACATHH